MTDNFNYPKDMSLADTSLYNPQLSVYKFIIPFETPLLVDGEMHFPGCSLVLAESESQALLILLRYCKTHDLLRRRDWEWLFYCDVEVLSATSPGVLTFISL